MAAMRLAFGVLLATMASGQTTNQVFAFTNTATAQSRQQIVDAIRTIGEIQQISLNNQAGTMAVAGTAGQLALAEWLFHNLDLNPQAPKPAAQEFTVPGTTDDVARVFYLSPGLTMAQMQNLANAVRTIGEVKLAYPSPNAGALCLRGTAAKGAFAAWLVPRLDLPAGTPRQSGPQRFTVDWADPRRGDTLASVVFMTQPQTPQELQEVVNSVRTITDMSKVYAYLASRTICFRGNPGQVALAEWLVGALDRPAGAQTAPAEFTATGVYPLDSTAVRVLYFPPAATLQFLIDTTASLRASTQMMKLFPCYGPRAVTLRGTANQAAQAETLINSASQPGH